MDLRRAPGNGAGNPHRARHRADAVLQRPPAHCCRRLGQAPGIRPCSTASAKAWRRPMCCNGRVWIAGSFSRSVPPRPRAAAAPEPRARGAPQRGRPVEDPVEHRQQVAVEPCHCVSRMIRNALMAGQRRLVRTVLDQGGEDVADRDDTDRIGDGGACEAIRIAGAVEGLVVMADDIQGHGLVLVKRHRPVPSGGSWPAAAWPRMIAISRASSAPRLVQDPEWKSRPCRCRASGDARVSRSQSVWLKPSARAKAVTKPDTIMQCR